MAPTSDAKPAQRVPLRDFAIAVTLVGSGCVINNLALELIVSPKKNPFADPGAGSLLTLLQFVFIAALTLPSVCEWRAGAVLPRFAPTKVPLRHYGGMTCLFFAMSFLNNAAFAFNISQPLHMVFRSSSLVVTYAVGYLGFGKR
jgi:solute carrier family 35 (UDP-xylose/UDP-N-acetylglucosamine transporter), member B4